MTKRSVFVVVVATFATALYLTLKNRAKTKASFELSPTESEPWW